MLTHKIVGGSLQQAVCQVDQGQTIFAEPGKFLWKTPNVQLDTRLTTPAGEPQAPCRPRPASSKRPSMSASVCSPVSILPSSTSRPSVGAGS